MARPRTPTKIKLLKGTDRANRRNENEPVSDSPIGAAPESLDDTQTAAWNEIIGQAPAGVLTGADRIIVELTARLLVEIRDGNGSAAHYRQLAANLAKMGLSPADRSRVSVERPKETENRFAKFK